MSALKQVLSFWNDVEVAYGQKGNGATRKEFLLKIIGYKDGGTALDMLKKKIMSEYNGNEKVCDDLVKVFDAINLNLSSILEESQITDLNSYIGDLVVETIDTTGFVVGSVSEDFFSRLNPFERVDYSEVAVLELITKLGIASDYYYMDNVGDQHSYIASNCEGAIVVRPSNLPQFIANAQAGHDLYVKAYHAMQYLILKEDLGRTMVFLAKSKFRTESNQLFIEDGGTSVAISLSEHKKLESVECFLARHTNSLGEVLVVGLC